MAELLANVDVPTLRRISLLTLRLGQDEPALRPPLSQIAAILDHMKRSVALGQNLNPSEIKKLRSLLKSITGPRPATSMVEAATLDELRDLSRALSAA